MSTFRFAVAAVVLSLASLAAAAQDKVVYHVQNRELFDAVMSLDRRYRLPVLLYYYEGYRQREIAGLLGIPEETVRTRLARAREKLKHILSEVPQYA